MSLPAPHLDDRDFQGLVDEAKRFIQHRCPKWSDHNVSDPGVTLIEACAWMTDALLYRLNRVPERNYLKFLELIGLTPLQPTTASVAVTFRLSAPQDTLVDVREGTVVSTARSAPSSPAITYTTRSVLAIVPAASDFIGSMITDGVLRDHTPGLGLGQVFECFATTPAVGDALYIGLDQPAPSNTLLVRFQCAVGGHGIDPLDPPLAWESWDGDRWAPCFVEHDGTGGLNLSGDVEVHLPETHSETDVGGVKKPWVRCRVVDSAYRLPYRSSPTILSVSARVIGGTTVAEHGERVDNEVLGLGDGVPGQSFHLSRPPAALSAEPTVLQVQPATLENGTDTTTDEVVVRATSTGGPEAAWVDYTRVANFADSGPDDAHFTLDARTGEVRLGPAVRLAAGDLRQFGQVPPKGATVRLTTYRTGGGVIGNVAAGTVVQLRSSIPFIASVRNFKPAAGGEDAESIDEACQRAPLHLRTLNRAVTAEDYESLARAAAPECARVRCVLVEEGPDAGALRMLIVPRAPQEDGRIEFRRLVPTAETGERVQAMLDERRVVGTRVRIEPPSYVGVKIEASIRARPGVDPDRLRGDALTALYRYFNPLDGGPDGHGWPFGRPVQLGEVFAVLQRLRGLDLVENAVVLRANPVTGELSDPEDWVELDPTNLVFSHEHLVEVH